jgi:predicted AAA+ superfamily ATPase
MIDRIADATLITLAKTFKAVALTGPRQSGKTTLARKTFRDKPYVSLENPEENALALTDPVQFLSRYPDGAVFDEVQRAPLLFSYLQQILDENPAKGQFILTGPNNFLLLESITQSLAGRVGYLELLPFSLAELQRVNGYSNELNDTIFRGGYPAIAHDQADPRLWFASYVRSYVERDVRQIKNISSLTLFQRFVYLCAGRVGQQLNMSSLANDVGLDYKTIQSWLAILQAGYIIYLLPPYYRNFNKRIVKSPKLYFYDSGLVCYLLGITSSDQLTNHGYRGALFENFVITELIKNRFNRGERSNLFFFRDSTGNELDIVIETGGQVIPVEIKSAESLNDGFFKALTYWEKLSHQKGGKLIYAGAKSGIKRGDFVVKNWKDVLDL